MAETGRRRARSQAFYGGDRPDLGQLELNIPAIPRPEELGPRRRPPPATPVTLPVYSVVPYPYNESDYLDSHMLEALFVKPYLSKWTTNHQMAIGVELVNGTYIEDLVPRSYIPTKAWEERPAPEQSEQHQYDTSRPSSETLSNGASIPGHEAFYVRVNELKHDHDDAINALARRKPPPGRAPVRLSHYRKFWNALDQVSNYWNTSKDNYRPAGAPEPMEIDQQPKPHPPLTMSGPPVDVRDLLPKVASGENPSQDQVRDYYGRRTSTGRAMNNGMRCDLIADFIEPIVTTMGCHYEPHRPGPNAQLSRAVQIQNGLIRQDVSGLVFRGPRDRNLARQGWNEGPVIAVSCRGQFNFTQPATLNEIRNSEMWKKALGEANMSLLADLENPAARSKAKQQLSKLGLFVTDDQEPKMARWGQVDILDSFSEIGALLMLAQHRARNAKSEAEPKAGSGTWWREAPRYGGHESRGEETGTPLFNDDMTPFAESSQSGAAAEQAEADQVEQSAGIESEPAPPATVLDIENNRLRAQESEQKNTRQAKQIAQLRAKRDLRWKPPKPQWDAKTHFIAVGKGPEQEFEHVYLISSLFHHISILRLRIHPSMLSFLTHAKDAKGNAIPRPPPEHWGLYVSRSRWFDLLVPADRVEALRGVWGVMAYMMRDTDTGNPEDAAFARRLARAGMLAQAAATGGA